MHTSRIRLKAASVLVALTLALTGCAKGDGDKPEPAAAQSAPSETPSSAEPSASKSSEKPKDQIVFKPGDNSDQVRELQARLKQLSHLKAVPNGNYGPATQGAVTEFQDKEKLEVTGIVHATTWEALRAKTKEPTQVEMFPKQQVMGYGDNSDQVRELQARLKQRSHFKDNPTGYYGEVTKASVKAYQQAEGLEATGTVFEDTWEKLKSQTKQPTKDELRPPIELPTVDASKADLDDRCLTGRVLCISKQTNKLAWVIDGKVYKLLDVRFGAEGYETREGVFDLYWKSRDHHSTLYDSPMPFAMFFDGGQAVHYSENFAQNGYTGGSYGCVNVRDYEGIKWLFDQTQEGDKVIVHW